MTTSITESKGRDYGLLLMLVVANLAIGGFGGWLTSSSVGSWYTTITKPEWTPPDKVFGPVWTILYILIGVAAWQALRRSAPPMRRRAFLCYAFQLALNSLWSFSFFYLQNPGIGLINILVLDAAAIICAACFLNASKLAFILFSPYVVWILFASFLNAAIWQLNA